MWRQAAHTDIVYLLLWLSSRILAKANWAQNTPPRISSLYILQVHKKQKLSVHKEKLEVQPMCLCHTEAVSLDLCDQLMFMSSLQADTTDRMSSVTGHEPTSVNGRVSVLLKSSLLSDVLKFLCFSVLWFIQAEESRSDLSSPDYNANSACWIGLRAVWQLPWLGLSHLLTLSRV